VMYSEAKKMFLRMTCRRLMFGTYSVSDHGSNPKLPWLGLESPAHTMWNLKLNRRCRFSTPSYQTKNGPITGARFQEATMVGNVRKGDASSRSAMRNGPLGNDEEM
jgi:hypothetical protein